MPYRMSQPFRPARAKLTLGSLEKDWDRVLTVTAQYNPKELQVEQSVPWKKPEAATQTGTQPQPPSEGQRTPSKPQTAPAPDENYMALEFTGAEGRTMTLELLFDGVEGGDRSVDVAKNVAMLEQLARVIDPKSPDENKRRPHHCTVSWGDRGLPRFDCVIENLTTKYTMFSSDGQPLRATCTVKLREARMKAKQEPPSRRPGTGR